MAAHKALGVIALVIYVRMKAIGKRRDILSRVPYAIPDDTSSLRQLITAIVCAEAENYNSKEMEGQMIPFLTERELEEQASTGKIGFGRIYSDKKADGQRAAANAIQCWQDGLVRVFLNEDELTELDRKIEIPDGAVFTFIRLTFLTGVMW